MKKLLILSAVVTGILLSAYSAVWVTVSTSGETLQWDASPDPALLVYRVYVATNEADFLLTYQTAKTTQHLGNLNPGLYGFYVTTVVNNPDPEQPPVESEPSGGINYGKTNEACFASVTPLTVNIPWTGASNYFVVKTPLNCAWTFSNPNPWVVFNTNFMYYGGFTASGTVTGPTGTFYQVSGSTVTMVTNTLTLQVSSQPANASYYIGPTNFYWRVGSNTGKQSRRAIVNIAGQDVVITQKGRGR